MYANEFVSGINIVTRSSKKSGTCIDHICYKNLNIYKIAIFTIQNLISYNFITISYLNIKINIIQKQKIINYKKNVVELQIFIKYLIIMNEVTNTLISIIEL